MIDQERQSTGFQVEESAAEAYEEYVVPIFAPLAERLIDLISLREGDRVLDVACGTGIVARRVAERVGKEGTVTGLDINEGMLAVAEKTAAEVQPPFTWRLGDAADLPFPDERFDVVFCQQALQFFDDPTAALGEMRRVLAPNGRMISSVWRPLEHQFGNFVVAEAMERYGTRKAAEEVRSPYPAWDTDFLRTIARDAGFDDASITIEIGWERYPSIEAFVDIWLAATPLAELPEAEERMIREELVRVVAEELEEYTDDEGVVFPNESYVIRAHR